MGAATFQNPSDRCTPFTVTPVAQCADFFVRHLLGGSVSNAAAEPVAAWV
jgi:hypothetical protein